MTMSHGVDINLYHAGLLTVLVAAWFVWLLAAAWAERHLRAGIPVVLLACAAAVTALGDSVYAALVAVQWVGFAYLGVRLQRWRTRHDL